MPALPRSSRITLITLALMITAVAALGCSAASESYDEMVTQDRGDSGAMSSPAAPPSMDGGVSEGLDAGVTQGSQAPDANRMVILNKTLRLEVKDTPGAVESIRALVKTHNGSIQDLQVATDTDEWLQRYDAQGYAAGDGTALRGWVTVRVPAESFETFVDAAIALGDVRYQAENTEDVTQQHVDLTARLANLRAEEERLRTFFDAAKDVKDMLAVETELNRVRQEVESLDAQVKHLERQAAMATITIELTEPRAVVRPAGDDWGFRDAITNGVRAAADVLTFLIAFIIGTAPLWISGIIVFLVLRAFLRARRKKRAALGSQSAEPMATSLPETPDDTKL